MTDTFQHDLDAVASIDFVQTLLSVACRVTGMGLAVVARVTEDRWIACAVKDEIGFGLKAGGELPIGTTICKEIVESGEGVVVEDFSSDPSFADHPFPKTYHMSSYISLPIRRKDGSIFGTLCAADPSPRQVNKPEIVDMFRAFASIIGFHLTTLEQIEASRFDLKMAKENSALREQFIAVLSHDLRNPLTAIRGGLGVVRRSQDDGRTARVMDLMEGSARRMAELIDNLLDFARGRLGGGITLTRAADDSLEPMLHQVVGEFSDRDTSNRILTSIAITEPVNCDSRRLAQMVSNLLGNAVTYGAADKPIELDVRTADAALTISVANSGDPIPTEKLRSIFEPFSRGSFQGLGLGLYISHAIALAHGGTLSVSSSTEGTRFIFSMPLSSV